MIFDKNLRHMQKQNEKQIAKKIQYRTNMRRITQSEKSIHTLIDDYRRKAVEAERNGQHDAAVRFALEAQKMQRRLISASAVKNTLESAYSLSEASDAVLRILESSNDALDAGMGFVNPENIITAQVGMETTMEQINLLSEQQEDVLEQIAPEAEGTTPEGEEALRSLMMKKTAAQASKALADANRLLDELHPIEEGK